MTIRIMVKVKQPAATMVCHMGLTPSEIIIFFLHIYYKTTKAIRSVWLLFICERL
ncbi:hypothetical protein DHD32_07140 [Arenibacter sp. TNZ]|nr:hypothetical protein [Arenibacter sp. TNZ]